MKRKYLKPEVFSKEQLRLNETVADSCTILPINRYQDSSERRVIGQVIEGNYANYGYASKREAYGTRYSEAGNAGSIDFGVVGPIYQVIFHSDNGDQSFFWEDFNSNGRYDTDYECMNDVEEVLGSVITNDPRIVNSKQYGLRDNFQSVSGGTFTPSANMIGPGGKVVSS